MATDPCISICADRCAEFGEPPCYVICRDSDETWHPCAECLREAGIEPTPPPPDPNDAIGDLFS